MAKRAKKPFLKGVAAAAVLLVLIVIGAAVFFLSPSVFRAGVPTVIGTVGAGTKGIVISSFIPEVAALETVADQNENFIYTITVKNLGEQKAEALTATMVGGLGNGTAEGLSNIELRGGDPLQKIQGEEATGSWSVNLPDPRDTDITYTSTARVSYRYKTVNEVLVRIVNRDFLRQSTVAGAQQTVQSGVLSQKTTDGPLSVSATTRTPFIAATEGDVIINYEITNVGGGRTFIDSITSENLDKVKVTQTTGTGGAVQTAECKNAFVHRLSAGTRKVLSCTVHVTGVTTFVEVPITLTIDYSYFVQASTSVTVLRKIS